MEEIELRRRAKFAADHLRNRGYTVARVGKFLREEPPEYAPEVFDWVLIWHDENLYYTDEEIIDVAKSRGYKEILEESDTCLSFPTSSEPVPDPFGQEAIRKLARENADLLAQVAELQANQIPIK